MTRYSRQQIIFHWLSLLFISITYTAIEMKGLVPKSNPWHDYLKLIHFNAGCLVFIVMVIRLILRKNHIAPPISPTPPQWQLTLSTLVHKLMYLSFILLPILGLLVLTIAGKQWNLLGIHIPAFMTADKVAAKPFKELHETIANLSYFLIALHAGAAIYHHHVVKDDTLKRMLP